MSAPVKRHILVVDDDESVREVFTVMLQEKGYQVATAKNGFDALVKLKEVVIPDVIISDLNMPEMSGFEFLSVVRRRFPKISAIASSGAYGSRGVPTGVLADAFYAKGGENSNILLNSVAELIRTSAARAVAQQEGSAPVWIPRNGKDSKGVPYVVITCTECLRSFPLNITTEQNPKVVETPCLFCGNKVKYIIDFSLSVASPPRKLSASVTTITSVRPELPLTPE